MVKTNTDFFLHYNERALNPHQDPMVTGAPSQLKKAVKLGFSGIENTENR